MIHVDEMDRVMFVLADSLLPGEDPDASLDRRARAEGVCPDCLTAFSVMHSDTPDEAGSFLMGVIIGVTMANTRGTK